jgi:DNA-binding NarL/FixJ family response regulator
MKGKADHINILQDLCPRQRVVLELIANGFNTKLIAVKLKISDKTVDFHRRNLMSKTKLFNVAELTRLALRLGLSNLNP